jgi:cholesterol transport system auxiliary component
MKRIASFLLLLSLISLTFGCVQLQRDIPPRNTYVISVSREAPQTPPNNGQVLAVRRLNVSHLLQGRSFVYRSGEMAYETDFYNGFLASPGPLLGDEVRRWLAASGLFARVTDGTGPILPDLQLEGTIAALYGDFRRDVQPAAVMTIEFALIDITTPRTQILHQKVYQQTIPISNRSPAELVRGWQEGLRAILVELEEDLRG